MYIKHYRNKLRYLLFLFLVCVATCSLAQIKDKETFEQVLHDIQTRNLERPIQLISNELSSMEQLSVSEFKDSDYIELTCLLATTYIQNNKIDEAEKLLSHAINFFDGDLKTSPFLYQLYNVYGAFSFSIENYETAKIYLEVAVSYLRSLESKNEEFALMLSVLAMCHLKTNQLQQSYEEIMESVSIIESSSSRFSQAYLIQVYEKAGTICHEIALSKAYEINMAIYEHSLFSEAKKYIKKAYDLSRDHEEYISGFVNSGSALATIYLDEEKYSEALSILHQIENLRLSEIEKSNIYNGIFLANYYLGNEEQCAEYALKSSNLLKEISINMLLSFPLKEQEEKWASNSMQLKLNMNILDKFSDNKEALRMSYDNALFLKNLTYKYNDYLRNACIDNQVRVTLTNIKQLRSKIFTMDCKEDYPKYRKELTKYEWLLLNQLQTSGNGVNISHIPSWQEVKDHLQAGEYAIEFISYSGFNRIGEKKKLRYAALVLSSQMENPKFIYKRN